MNQFLKQNSIIKNDRLIFSKLSLITALVLTCLFIIAFTYIPTTLNARNPSPIIPNELIFIIYILCFTGGIVSIMSILKKEKWKYWKFIGNGMCFIYLFLILALFILYRI